MSSWPVVGFIILFLFEFVNRFVYFCLYTQLYILIFVHFRWLKLILLHNKNSQSDCISSNQLTVLSSCLTPLLYIQLHLCSKQLLFLFNQSSRVSMVFSGSPIWPAISQTFTCFPYDWVLCVDSHVYKIRSEYILHCWHLYKGSIPFCTAFYINRISYSLNLLYIETVVLY